LRAIIIYSGESKGMEAVVQALFASIQAMGHEARQVKAEKSARTESLFLYDLVYVGSPVLGFWGGKFSEPLASYLKKCSGLEGKKVAVFVIPKLFGVSKTLKRIMKLLEEKGSIVIAFQSIKKLSEARDFGKRLSKPQ
jgi:menaquinone-dependent protoporphyrinogen IX oxidase